MKTCVTIVGNSQHSRQSTAPRCQSYTTNETVNVCHGVWIHELRGWSKKHILHPTELVASWQTICFAPHAKWSKNTQMISKQLKTGDPLLQSTLSMLESWLPVKFVSCSWLATAVYARWSCHSLMLRPREAEPWVAATLPPLQGSKYCSRLLPRIAMA